MSGSGVLCDVGMWCAVSCWDVVCYGMVWCVVSAGLISLCHILFALHHYLHCQRIL